MKRTRTFPGSQFVPLLIAGILTLWAWERYVSGMLALGLFPILLVRDGTLPAGAGASDLFQPVTASAVWTGFLVWLLLSRPRGLKDAPRGVRSPGRARSERPSGREQIRTPLLAVTLVALAAPLFVTVDPTVQGELSVTRLLPPLAQGIRVRFAPPVLPDNLSDPLRDTYVDAAWSLHPSSVFVSGAASREGGPPHGAARGGTAPARFLFLLGTDDVGRDVFSRIVAGAQVSLLIGLLAAGGALALGFGVGFLAGWSARMLDGVIMRITDLFLAIPSLFLALGAVTVFEPSPLSLVIILALTGWMSVARIVRGEVQVIRQKEYVDAARLLNVSTPGIIRSHVLPNLKPVLKTAFVFQFGAAILAESALGFLGVGVRPPTPSWGTMLGESLGFLTNAWWLGVFPGLALAVILVAAHAYGESRRPLLQ